MRPLAQAVRSPGPRSRGRVRASPQNSAVGPSSPARDGICGGRSGSTNTDRARPCAWLAAAALGRLPCGCRAALPQKRATVIPQEHTGACSSKYVPLFKFRKYFSIKITWAKIGKTATSNKRKTGVVTAAEKLDFFLKHVYLEL